MESERTKEANVGVGVVEQVGNDPDSLRIPEEFLRLLKSLEREIRLSH